MSPLVEIRGLNIRFTGERTVYAVNDLSLSLGDGEVLGLLGESGSGKSVTLRALMRLLPKKRTQIAGDVRVMGRDVLALDDEELSDFRGQTVSMIFQEPGLALDPVYTIGRQIAETVMRHEGKSHAEGRARALEMLEVVHIPSAKRRLDAYPHEMSGGMRQRAMIALALPSRPKILLAATVHGAKRGARLETIPGTPPSLDKPPVNCAFAPRCSVAESRCTDALPPNVRLGPDRIARCILAERSETVALT